MQAESIHAIRRGARRSGWLTLCLGGALVLPGQFADASPRAGDIDMPNGMRIAASQARGMDCAYQAPAEYADPRLAWLPATSPAMAVPPKGNTVYLVSRATSGSGPILVRADATTTKATIIGTPTSPAAAASSRVCQVVTDANGSVAAVLLIAPDGAVQWSILRAGGQAVAVNPPDASIATPAAAFTPDGTGFAVVAKPCATCNTGYRVLAFDGTTGAQVGVLDVPIDPAVIAGQSEGLILGPSQTGFVLAARTPGALALWSLSPTLRPLAQRELGTQPGQDAARTPSCRAQPGIQVSGNLLIASARINIDAGALSGVDPGELPAGESVSLIDATTLQDRVSFPVYRRPRPTHAAEQTLCPYFGPGGDVVDASLLYSPRTGKSLGWLSIGSYLPGRFQNGERIWQVREWESNGTFVSFEPWLDTWVWRSDIPQNFPPTLSTASASQVLASPAWTHLLQTVQAFPDEDFTMYSFTDTEDDFLTTINLDRRGDTYRFVEPYFVDEPRKIVYANRTRWCTRTTTRKLPDSFTADMKARWTCRAGAQGWQRAQAAASRALTAEISRVQTQLAKEGTLTLYGTDLADAKAQRIEWWPGTGIVRGGSSVACAPGERPAACQILDLELGRTSSSMPRLASSGRLIR